MDAKVLKSKLRGLLIGKKIYYYKEIGSTNDEAKRLTRLGIGEGTVVVSECQTSGRGKLGRTWFSPKGKGLYLTVIIQPFKTEGKTLPITLLGALSSARAINGLTGLSSRVKWPNDIMVNGKKVGGVLTEVSRTKKGTDAIVVGIGLNVYTEKKDFPEDLAASASSLSIEAAKKVTRSKLIKILLEEFEKLYFLLLAGKADQIIEEWKILSDTVGHHIKIRTGAGLFEGRVTGIGRDGELILKMIDGRIKRFTSGDIEKG